MQNIKAQNIAQKRAKKAVRRRRLFAKVQSVKSVKANKALGVAFNRTLFLEDLKSPLNPQTLLKKAKSAVAFKVRLRFGVLDNFVKQILYQDSVKKAIQAL